MLETLKDTITDPSSDSIEWVHTAAEIVEGVEVVMAVVKGAGATAATQGLVDLFEGIEGAGAGFAWPITTGVAAIVAEFAAIGMGYKEAADEIKEQRSAVGFSEGVVMGAMKEQPAFIKSNFVEWSPEPNAFFEAGGKIAQTYYNAGLVLGFDYGHALTAEQTGTLFRDLARQGGAIADLDANSSEHDWRNFYIDAGARFHGLHIN
jgi:hypothetical protein